MEWTGGVGTEGAAYIRLRPGYTGGGGEGESREEAGGLRAIFIAQAQLWPVSNSNYLLVLILMAPAC